MMRNNGSVDAVMVKMIDFGRVRRQDGGDHGYRVGLKQLSHCVTELLDTQQEQKHQQPQPHENPDR